MLGVLLNLLLGLSRVLLAMARRGDMPQGLARLEGSHASPRRAVFAVGAVIALLALTGSVRTTWSFSAFTVLVYYAITNVAALRLPADLRLYPRWIAAAGAASCLGLAFWVEPRIWLAGLGLIVVGLGWRAVARRS
jgi:APA family basic amino acid/polyamine antiporter